MNEKDFTLLDDYFNGLLSAEASEKVLERLATDQAFQEAFHLRELLESHPKRAQNRADFLQHISNLGDAHFGNSTSESPELTVKTNKNMRWLSIAAASVLLVSAIWFFTQPEAKPSYNQFAQHTPLSITLRGATDLVSTDAEKAFNAKNYETAKAALSILVNQNPDNITAKLYLAICRIELGQTEEARNLLTPIATGNSALKGDASWYIALSYLRDNHHEAFKKALSQINATDKRYKKAQELLDSL